MAPVMRWWLAQNAEYAHLAASKHSRTTCGWNLLNSKGLPQEVKPGDGVLRCARCEQKQRDE